MKKKKGARKALSPALMLVLKEVGMYRWKIILGGILVLVGSLMLLPRPFAMGYVIDVVFPNKDVRMLLIAVGLLFLVHLLKALQLYFVGVLFYKINNKIIIDIRRVLFEKLSRVKLSEYKKYGTGYLMSRLKDDPHRLSILFGEKIIPEKPGIWEKRVEERREIWEARTQAEIEARNKKVEEQNKAMDDLTK